MNRPFAALVMLATLTGSTFAVEPTPAQRSTRTPQSSPVKRQVAAPQASRSQPVSRDAKLIGAGVRRETEMSTARSEVAQASASSPSRVVRANAQVVHEGVVYEDGAMPQAGDYIVSEGVGSEGGSCSSCGTSGCDGMSCGTACGDASGWGSCGFDLCSPGPGKRRQLCICLPSHGWAQFDYLMWYQDGMYVPPLVSTSPNGTAVANAGVLSPGSSATIRLGDQDILTERMNGGRLRFGWWFANCPKLGIEGEYFGFRTLQFDDLQQSTGNPILARPFFNMAPESGLARDDAELVAFPNVITGSVATSAFSTIDGAAVRFRRMLCCGTNCSYAPLCCGPVQTQSRIDATLGWRFLQLREGLTIDEDLTSLSTVEPGRFEIQDNFTTRNQFNGVEMGVLWSTRRGYWTLDALLRCSVGNMRQEVNISGTTNISQTNGQNGNFNTGFLAQRTNIGTYTQDVLGVVPELGATLGYALTQRWRLTAGYTFIHWNSVVRPGDQIDLDVNPNLLAPEANPFTGALRPQFAFRETNYWIQGLNLGAEYRW